MIRHCITVVSGEYVGPYVFLRSVQSLVAIFYEDNRILASPLPSCVQEALEFLIEIFGRVGLHTNMNKTV